MVDRRLDDVFDYISDFTTTAEWDPGTVTTVRREGDGGVGTRYLNMRRFGGRTVVLDYTVTDCVANHVFALHGRTPSLDALVRFTVREATVGPHRLWTRLTFTGDYQFRGRSRLARPILASSLEQVCDAGQHGLEQALLARPRSTDIRRVS